MWKKFKWDMFVTSFIPLWLSIIVIDVWTIVLFILANWNRKEKLSDNLMNVLYGNYIQLVSIAVISVLVLVSIIGINSFLEKKLIKDKKHLPKGKIEKATKANKLSSEFLLAYILPMIAFDFGNPQNLVFIYNLFLGIGLSLYQKQQYLYEYSLGIQRISYIYLRFDLQSFR